MNAATYTELLQENRDRIYSRALYTLRDPDDAADVTQEVFLRLWRAGDDVSPAKIEGWLSRVVHNLCIDQIRRRKVVYTHLGTASEDAAAQLPAPHDAQGDPEWWLRLDERQRRLLDAMTVLTAETRSIVMMHYFQGMKLHEIAELVGKTVSALKVQIHRARRTLRSVLEADAAREAAAGRGTG